MSRKRKHASEQDALDEALNWLRRSMAEIAKSLNRASEENIFEPSPEITLEKYAEKIKEPICLPDIEGRCRRRYQGIDEFRVDLQLMHDNCVQYNGVQTKWAKFAAAVLRDGNKMLDNLQVKYDEFKANKMAALDKPPPTHRAGTKVAVPIKIRDLLRADWAMREAGGIEFPTKTKVQNILDEFMQSKSGAVFSTRERENYTRYLDAIKSVLTDPELQGKLLYTPEEDAQGVNVLLRLLVIMPDIVNIRSPEEETALILATEELLGFVDSRWDAYLNS
eukprot:TRINITY_DN14505_c0_g1_i1.p1 TRINITY_DN14505_c0_g1~~TRINITY_DN14505_c0_g1_i1.p1  ORF type:complete len:278 (+),score=57.24 TRINITY_DN14505_c0_g1_i1:35-868(+)